MMTVHTCQTLAQAGFEPKLHGPAWFSTVISDAFHRERGERDDDARCDLTIPCSRLSSASGPLNEAAGTEYDRPTARPRRYSRTRGNVRCNDDQRFRAPSQSKSLVNIDAAVRS